MDPDEQTLAHLAAEPGLGEMAVRELLPLVYEELRRLAATHFAQERPDHTLQPTALANEAYMLLAGDPRVRVANRTHFFRLASKVMRQILVDHARKRDALKRRPVRERVLIDDGADASSGSGIDLLALNDAMERLAVLSPRKARLMELRFFGGLSIEDAADVMDISRTQATREWRTARAWLADELGPGGGT